MSARSLFVRSVLGAVLVVPACVPPATRGDDVATTAQAVTDTDIATCMQPYSDQEATWKQQGVAFGEIRKRLETAFVQCRAPETSAPFAAYVGAVNADSTRAGALLSQNQLAYTTYTAVVADRQRKLQRVRSDSSFVAALTSGDADADLIPDSLDTCPGTPDLTATDDSGCPVSPAACPKGFDRCDDTGAKVNAALSTVQLWFNPKCDGATSVSPSQPLAWGRGTQGSSGTSGFNFLVSKVRDQPAGCEVFYEVEFRSAYDGYGNPTTPTYATAVYSEREAIRDDGRTLMFPVKSSDTGARGRVFSVVARWTNLMWRVRSLNGSQTYSAWSAFRPQSVALQGVGTP